MCFSPEASFTAGVILTAAGIFTIKSVKKKTDLPLASIPLVFGIQQIIEGGVWLSFHNAPANTMLTYLFVLIAYIFWPVFIPFAVLSLETSPWHKKALWCFQIAGIFAALGMAYTLFTTPINSFIQNNSICYNVQNIPTPIAILYLSTLCFAYFFSSKKFIKLLGAGAVISLMISYYFYTFTYASTWCFFAALISISIYWYFNPTKKTLKRSRK